MHKSSVYCRCPRQFCARIRGSWKTPSSNGIWPSTKYGWQICKYNTYPCIKVSGCLSVTKDLASRTTWFPLTENLARIWIMYLKYIKSEFSWSIVHQLIFFLGIQPISCLQLHVAWHVQSFLTVLWSKISSWCW